MPAVYSKTCRRARKPHRCYECRGTIAKGESYNSHEGLWDGRWSTYKVCLDCDSLRNDLDARVTDYDDRICFGDLEETALDSPDPVTFHRFLGIQRKRGAKVWGWVSKREEELLATA